METYTPTGSAFNATIDEFDTSDRAHADVLNVPVEQLAENAQFLKNKQGDLSELATEEKTDLVKAINEMANVFADGAGAHNCVYRGKKLGTSVSAEQYTAISNGTFKDMFIGDYWEINSVVWRIAAFDYWLHCGDTECTKHHVLIVPDSAIVSNVKMNSTNITTGAYVGSDFYTGNNSNTAFATAKNAINTAFGSSHILNHREYLPNATSNGRHSAGSWYDSTVELMTEQMVYGKQFGTVSDGTNVPANYTIDNAQLPLFALDHSKICNRAAWWLRDVVSSAYFAIVTDGGLCDYGSASAALGVRPAFAICAA